MYEKAHEEILELLNKDPEVKEAIHDEYLIRFPKGVPADCLDEVMCMCTLLVYNRVLKQLIR